MVAIAASFLRESGLSPDQVSILVNNRKLMDGEVQSLGIPPELRLDVFHLIDRRDKMEPEKLEAYAGEIGLSTEQLDDLVAILEDKKLWMKSPDMVRLFAIIESLGISQYVRYAPHVVRGLDYYTGTVFEAWDKDGEFRAILGGGRYDDLVSDVGGDPLPAVGFAMGDLVISLVLQKFDCLPEDVTASPAPVLVTVFDEDFLPDSFQLATQLRTDGFNVTCYPEAVKLGKQLKYADRMGMKVALILGPDERANGQVAIKDLRTGEQEVVPQENVAEKISKIITNA
jgi:histidyl-tRNA synthetase